VRRLLILAFVSLASVAQAQPTITRTLSWTQDGLVTIAEVQALLYRLSIDGAPSQPLTPSCALVNAVVACTTPVPSALGTGPHQIVLSVLNEWGTASASITGAAPQPPGGFKMSINITIN